MYTQIHLILKLNSGTNITPYINRKLTNIKSIKLDQIILPNYYELVKFPIDKSTTLMDEIILDILNNNSLSTDIEYIGSNPTNYNIIIIWFEKNNSNYKIDFFD